jgi:hypothetical protein
MCVIFTYLYHITFFGACMAIAGYAEKDNRHSITCIKVLAKSQSRNIYIYIYYLHFLSHISTYLQLCVDSLILNVSVFLTFKKQFLVC